MNEIRESANLPPMQRHSLWAVWGAVLFLLMLAIILVVPRLHARADQRACLNRLQAFASAVAAAEADNRQHRHTTPDAPAPPGDVDDGISERYFCPKTKNQFVYVGANGSPRRDDLDRVIAYEPWTDRHGEGGCVIYGDRRAAFLPTEQYHAATARGH